MSTIISGHIAIFDEEKGKEEQEQNQRRKKKEGVEKGAALSYR